MERSEPDGRLTNAGAARTVRQILAILHKWGIHTLGQLMALDKEELAARLGPEAARLWERANGKTTRLLKLVQPPESFTESFEFENEIETAEPLLFMLRRFLEQLALRLSAIYLVAKELNLRITFSNKQSYERSFKIPQPTNDVDLLFRMLQTHLENFKSEHPIIAVALTAQPIRPASKQFGLFETSLRNPSQLYETLARLTALLGVDRVGTPVLEETHRPDAFRIEPLDWHRNDECRMVRAGLALNDEGNPKSQNSSDTTARVPPGSKPALRRFRPAAAASVFTSEIVPAHIRSADPFGCRSGQASGKIADQGGPYFASGNWWDEKSWERAEWDLQINNGTLLRAHESPPSSSSGAAGEGTWKIDGIYD